MLGGNKGVLAEQLALYVHEHSIQLPVDPEMVPLAINLIHNGHLDEGSDKAD